jgi:putative component of membrane protein insertase Oxa1/YidC/SpoIIIJ protein YidD
MTAISLASSLGVTLIEAYQRWLSPHKGFCCAYGALHGSGTCSSIGKRIMREQGALKFLRLMPTQFAACKAAASILAAETAEQRAARRKARLAQYPALNDACNLAACACDVTECGSALDCAPGADCAACSLDGIGACF